MISILIVFIIARRVKTLLAALIAAILVPICFFILALIAGSRDPSPVIILSIPVCFIVAYFTFKLSNHKRLSLRFSNASVDECKEALLESIQSCILPPIIRGLKKYEPETSTWSLLNQEIERYITVIKNSSHISTILVAHQQLLDLIKETTKTEENTDDKMIAYQLFHCVKSLFTKNEIVTSRLISIHGHNITDIETQTAIDFINSFKWDSEKKSFVQS